MFNMQEFVSTLNKTGVARASNFSLLLSSPLSSPDIERDIMMRCEGVNMAGRNLTVSPHVIYGLPKNIVTGSSMQPLNISIIASEDMREKVYLEKWQDLAIGKYRNGRVATNMFDIGYYHDYIGTAMLYTYGVLGNVVYTIEYKDVFPYDIGEPTLAWSSGQEIIKIPVTLSYRYFVDSIEKG